MRISKPTLYVGLILMVLVSLLVNCNSNSDNNNQNNLTNFTYLNHHDSVDYVGMDMCAQCHQDKHQTFIHTGMGKSFGEALSDRSSAVFHKNSDLNTVFDSANNLYYQPFRKGGYLWIKEFELDGVDTVFQRTERIDFIVGSGQHTNSHLIIKNGYVVQAPLTFYTQDKKWDLPPGFENGANSRFTRIIDSECMSCHNSIPVMKKNQKRRFELIGKGIDCERCHGPGELHVQYRQKVGLKKTGKFDSTIVNPARLSSELLIDLCQRCHLQGNNVLQEGKEFTDFKPGMILSDVFEVYLPKYQGDHSQFNMADHSARMQMSECFKNSNGQLTCISCHNPHVSVQQTKAEAFNQNCRSCHSIKKCTAPQEERDLKQNSCFTCHMPMSGSKDIPHVRIHDHNIQIPQAEKLDSNKKLIGLYSVNNSNPSNEMMLKAYLSYYEKFDPQNLYMQKAKELLPKVKSVEQQIHFYFLNQKWNDIIQSVNAEKNSEKFEDAFTPYRIAVAYKNLKQYNKAVIWMKKAINQEPDRFEFRDELGSIYLKMNKLDLAVVSFKESISWYPFSAKTHNNLGYTYFKKGDNSMAKQSYERALSLNHQYVPVLENLALLYLVSNQRDKAIEYLEIALKYPSDSERILQAINRIKHNYE